MVSSNRSPAVLILTALLPSLLSAMVLPVNTDVNATDLYERHIFARQEPTLFSEGERDDPSCVPEADPFSTQINAATRKTFLDGDGRPHQNYLYRQISDNNGCDAEGGNSCEISKEESRTTGFSRSINVGGGITGGTNAIQGGLSLGFTYEVSESTTSGQTATCAGQPGDTICGWWREAHTAFKVYDIEYCRREETSRGQIYTVLVPNSKQRGSQFLCGTTKPDRSVDECRHPDFEFWNDNGNPPGGPQSFLAGNGDDLVPPPDQADIDATVGQIQPCNDAVRGDPTLTAEEKLFLVALCVP